jgi:hypothetical protein
MLSGMGEMCAFRRIFPPDFGYFGVLGPICFVFQNLPCINPETRVFKISETRVFELIPTRRSVGRSLDVHSLLLASDGGRGNSAGWVLDSGGTVTWTSGNHTQGVK